MKAILIKIIFAVAVYSTKIRQSDPIEQDIEEQLNFLLDISAETGYRLSANQDFL